MKKAFERFSRIVALTLVVTVSFMSCPIPGSPPPEDLTKLTPGKGTPRSFYLDKDGNYLETEEDGPGRTGLVVEDNKQTEGVLIYSDDTDADDRVAFVYKDSIVSMFFKKGNNFPDRMAISDNSNAYFAYISPYDDVNNAYHVTFMRNGSYEMMDNIVLNGNIFSLYQDDAELSDSQNRRMANMTIAMGVWGSLYATFEQQNSGGFYIMQRGIFSSICRGVAKFFSAIAVAAAVVATVVVPIISLINPAAGLAVAAVAKAVGVISIAIVAAAEGLACLVDALEDKGGSQNLPPAIPEKGIPIVVVTLPNEGNRNIKYDENGAHEEFHIPPGADLLVQLYMTGYDFSTVTTEILNNGFMFIDEPCVPKGGYTANLGHFKNPPAVVVESESSEILLIKIMRSSMTGHNEDGKVNFGFVFNGQDEQAIELKVNDYTGGFYFRLPQDDEPVLYKNMIVIHFCIVEDCPDIFP